MADPFVGEIRLFAGGFAPVNWALCAGQLMSISENPTLYSLLGTTYGGDGTTTFGLPDLRSRVPVHQGTLAGNVYVIGQSGGLEGVTLTPSTLPGHTHAVSVVKGAGTTSTPAATTYLANALNVLPALAPFLAPGGNQVALAATSFGNAGGGQPHSNIQPCLAINFIIALAGIYPSQN
jgi:microcystin-dependent protein